MAFTVRALAWLGATLWLAQTTAAHAGGFTITIVGGRRTGMMAALGRPDDLTAIVHNPAGLADQPGQRLHLSTSATFLSTQFDVQALDPVRFPEINPAGCGAAADPCPWPIDGEGYYEQTIEPERYFGILPFAGGSSDLGAFSPKLKKVVAGLAVHAPNFYGAYLPDDAPTAYHVIQGTFLVLATTAAVGWRINRYVSIGGSLSYNYMRLNYAQKFSLIDVLTDPGATPDGTAEAAQSLLGDVRLDYTGVDHGFGWGLGLLLTPFDALSVGVNYNGATAARFEGDLELRALGRYAQTPGALESSMDAFGYKMPRRLTVEMVIPHSFQVGFNVRVRPWLELAFDYRIWFYNFYKSQDLIPHYDEGPGEEPMTKESLSRDKSYRVSYEVSGGVLFRPWFLHPALEVMAGVAYDRSPIPGETFTLDNPSLSQIGWSVGARMMLGRHWRVSATYMVLHYLPRDIRNSKTSPPTNGRGRGIAHIPRLEGEYFF